MSKLMSVFVVLLLAIAARAQVDPCYCIQTVSWDQVSGRWVTDECAGGCALLEGACETKEETIGGTLFRWCQCTNAPFPNCYCFGKVRNPGYDPRMLAPLILCTTLSTCPGLSSACKPDHLLDTWGWGSAIPICLCD